LKRIAIFAEGQTEIIFIRNLLLRVLDPSKLSFECYELLAHKESNVPYRYPNPSADIHFLILDVHGDGGVMSSIKDREKNLIEKRGYERIIGLRDMYSAEYVKYSPGVVNDEISKMMIQRYNQTIGDMTYSDRIKFYFAIMEVEAWFLGMHTLFQKIDSVLTIEYIKQKLKIDLKTADPQKEFYRPSDQVRSILQLCGREYKKKQGEIESICSNIDSSDLDAARENNRCACFDDFYKEITSYSRFCL
jgi:hypothetical protein